jgi:hypothetical protein
MDQATSIGLAQNLAGLFATSIQEQFPNISSYATPEDLQPTSMETRGTPIRRRYPTNIEDLARIRIEIQAANQGQVHVLPTHWVAPESPQILPEVSMGSAVNGAPPASRRIRQALRAVVGEGPEDQRSGRTRSMVDQYRSRNLSRQSLLEAFGLSETSTRQELEEGVPSRLPLALEPPRGRQALGVMLDDAAEFEGPYTRPVILGDSHLAQDVRDRSQARIEGFQAIYGGDQYRSLGVEPPFQPRIQPRARVKEPKPPEDRTSIPTRYQRKPVI